MIVRERIGEAGADVAVVGLGNNALPEVVGLAFRGGVSRKLPVLQSAYLIKREQQNNTMSLTISSLTSLMVTTSRD